MARVDFGISQNELERLQTSMEEFGNAAGGIVDGVLHSQGAETIKSEIMQLLPVSGRTWAGKAPPASQAKPFTQESGSMSVTVKTISKYNYLYFPDDGSNTRRHVGNQRFMLHGAENSSQHIIDLCIEQLINKFEG